MELLKKKAQPSRILELFAVVFNLLFTFLYQYQSWWCFVFGIVGPALLAIVLYKKSLFAETFLQFIYIALAIYGWLHISGTWDAIKITPKAHAALIVSGILFTFLAGHLLKKYSTAQLPYIDSFTTVFAIIATALMMVPVHEAWLYFIAINSVSIFMYTQRRLYLGAIMFTVYLLLSIKGYFF
ncbi:MAG: nicotinamide riboside transporter PnuC [Flavobacteriales bacterium]|jgi:nicotinamide mononucleotide transporter